VASLNVEHFRRLLERETDEVAPADLKAVRTTIGAALRTLHSDVLREEVPERIAELLRQLD
jgi:Anti-sigma factor NepR